jgi:hypothetical protein
MQIGMTRSLKEHLPPRNPPVLFPHWCVSPAAKGRGAVHRGCLEGHSLVRMAEPGREGGQWYCARGSWACYQPPKVTEISQQCLPFVNSATFMVPRCGPPARAQRGARGWQLVPVILAIWEAEIGRIRVQGQPR